MIFNLLSVLSSPRSYIVFSVVFSKQPPGPICAN